MSASCFIKRVHFATVEEDETIYFTTVDNGAFTSDSTPNSSPIFLSDIAGQHDATILLGIHIFHDPKIVTNVQASTNPVTVQGITGDRVRVTKEATIEQIGLSGYYSSNMTANIISYHMLKDTHNVHYDNDTDMFTRDYFDNERRGIAKLPAVSSTL